MINSLKAKKLLYGYRGGAELDVEALADIIVKVSDYAFENIENLVEMDINPVIMYPKGEGAIAVDALIILRK